MDAQWPFASRDDIWRVFDDLRDLSLKQDEQASRIAGLERFRDEDAKMKNLWGVPPSPFPTALSGPITTGTYTATIPACLYI
jgi:hypothetical protein